MLEFTRSVKARFIIALAMVMFGSTVANAACDLSATAGYSSDVTRQLLDTDKVAITEAARAGGDITTCDVSGISDFSRLFDGLGSFNQDIGDWDTSNVTDMTGLFYNAYAFDQDISGWDTSKVTSMSGTFRNASVFNQDIGDWDTSNVTNMVYMFESALLFNKNIGGWNTSNVTQMYGIFRRAAEFNQDIGGWDVSNVTRGYLMFSGASKFNGDISGWDISNMQDVVAMFQGASAFNQDIGGWQTAQIAFFEAMFSSATSFNQDLGAWDTSNATSMSGMFAGASSFEQEIRGWSVGSVQSFDGMFAGAFLFQSAYSVGATPDASFFTGTISPNADLANLTISSGTLSPAFQVDVTTYSISTNIPTITVTPTTTLEYLTVAVNGIAVASGDASGAIALTSGLNTVSIVVTARDGVTTKTYSLNIATDAASEFESKKDAIKAVITSEAQRNLRSDIDSNQRLTRDARERFVKARQQAAECAESGCDDAVSQNAVPFDVDGTAGYANGTLSTRGTFFGSQGNAATGVQRVFFGDFDIQREQGGSTTATLNAKMAWEQLISEQTLLGYFVGGSVARSDINGSFAGENTQFGIKAGGYVVHQLDEALFFDGFVSLGAGRNDLEISDDVLALTSDYITQTMTLGVALSGVITKAKYEIRPELSFSYGKTWVGDVGLSGTAYGATDDTLSLDAGSVSLASLMFRPEFIIPFDDRSVGESRSVISLAPRLICEHTSSVTSRSDCGAGAEIGFSSASSNGQSNGDIKLVMDRIGSSTRSSVQFGVSHNF